MSGKQVYLIEIETENAYNKKIIDNFVYPQQIDVSIDLPDGYKLVYGD